MLVDAALTVADSLRAVVPPRPRLIGPRSVVVSPVATFAEILVRTDGVMDPLSGAVG
jgi:hypothetical protein